MKTIGLARCVGTLARAAVLKWMLFAGFAQAQTNLVVNGSFEAGPAGQNQFTGWGWVAGSDTNSDFGVAQSTGGNEVAEQGKYFAYFRGHPTDNSQDCLGTGLALKVGGLYNISYWLGTDGALTNGAAMWAQIGTSFGLNPQCAPLPPFFPNATTALSYLNFSTNWIATDASVILSFHGINATNGLAVTNGILLDNVSVVLIYPPLNLTCSEPGSLVFTWPFTNSPYRLQSSPSLPSADWTTLTNTPVNDGTNNVVTLPIPTNNAQFYQLTLP
jgi:hypothetical protein